jgi:hypothetical protein
MLEFLILILLSLFVFANARDYAFLIVLLGILDVALLVPTATSGIAAPVLLTQAILVVAFRFRDEL